MPQIFICSYNMPNIVLGTGNTTVSKTDKNTCPDRTYILVE